jgi:uncharacterized membrane protein HdeD (DUF308 family)
LFTRPGLTTVVILQFLGVYWLISGVFSVLSIFADGSRWVWKLPAGILGIVAGLAIINHPLLSAILLPTTLFIILAIFGIGFGVFYLIQAFRGGSLGWGVLGVLSILVGLLLLSVPFLSVAALPYLFGIVGVVGGVAAIVMAFRAR